MSLHPFRIVNVFTQNGGCFTGNPLCVFEPAVELDTSAMQALARQFNLSETTFILPSTRANARVRIFTPNYEMPFAGHPTLGTAHVCRSLGLGADDLTLEMQAGIIPVRARADCWTLQANAPTWRTCDAEPAILAAMLGLPVEAVSAPALWVKAGKEQLVIPLRDAAAVRCLRPSFELFSQLRSEDGHNMAYVFAPIGPGQLLSRFLFVQGSAIVEDPATGSATANLGGWFLATEHRLPISYVISQGAAVDRPSTLYLDVDTSSRIFVGGNVVELGRGHIEL